MSPRRNGSPDGPSPKGLGIIEYEPYTLQKKADYYERHLDEWGQRRLGFTHKLEWDDQFREYVREVSDNDGGYPTSNSALDAPHPPKCVENSSSRRSRRLRDGRRHHMGNAFRTTAFVCHS